MGIFLNLLLALNIDPPLIMEFLTKSILCFAFIYGCLMAFAGASKALALQLEENSLTDDTVTTKMLVYDLFNQLYVDVEKFETGKKPEEIDPGITGDVQVFGWHPAWLYDSYISYDYDLLTTLSYAFCTMSQDAYGNLQYNTKGWETPQNSKMVDMARQQKCNVLLTLKCNKGPAIKQLFQNKNEQARCMQYLLSMITNVQPADGINVVFEDIPYGFRAEFASFIEELSEMLKAEGKSLVLALPAVPDQRKYDFQRLDNSVDQFVMMGYNYYYRGSNKPGPVAPLNSGNIWGKYNLVNSVTQYLKKGINKGKLIVALPYYGAVWQLDTLSSGEVQSTFFEHRRFNKIMADLGGKEPEYDTLSESAFYTFSEEEKNYICYFDNDRTLKLKFNWVKEQGLAGIGIWALGYDNKRPEMWQMLDENFAVIKNPGFRNPINSTATSSANKETISVTALKSKVKQILKDAINILKQKEILLVIGTMLLGFVFAGILLAFMSATVYEKFFIRDGMVYMKLMAGLLVFVLVGISVSNFVFASDEMTAANMEKYVNEPIVVSGDVTSVLIKIGLAVSVIISLLSWKVFLKLNKDVP